MAVRVAGAGRGDGDLRRTASRNAGVVAVLLPWWATFRRSSARQAARERGADRSSCSTSPVRRNRRPATVAEQHDRHVVDAGPGVRRLARDLRRGSATGRAGGCRRPRGGRRWRAPSRTARPGGRALAATPRSPGPGRASRARRPGRRGSARGAGRARRRGPRAGGSGRPRRSDGPTAGCRRSSSTRSRSGSGPPSTSSRPPRQPSTRIASPWPTSSTVIRVAPSAGRRRRAPATATATTSAERRAAAASAAAGRASAARRRRRSARRRVGRRDRAPVAAAVAGRAAATRRDDRRSRRPAPRRRRTAARASTLANGRPAAASTIADDRRRSDPRRAAASDGRRRPPAPRARRAPPARATTPAAIAGATSGTTSRLTTGDDDGQAAEGRPGRRQRRGLRGERHAEALREPAGTRPPRRERSRSVSGVAQARSPAVASARELEPGVADERRVDEQQERGGPAERGCGATRSAALAGEQDDAGHRAGPHDGRRGPGERDVGDDRDDGDDRAPAPPEAAGERGHRRGDDRDVPAGDRDDVADARGREVCGDVPIDPVAQADEDAGGQAGLGFGQDAGQERRRPRGGACSRRLTRIARARR